MNLSQLEVLVAIAETGSLTEAADVVGLTQSAVSYSLSRLEAELGVTLLERGRQGVTVTRIGAEILQHARDVMNQVEAIRQKSTRERGLTAGKLRFGCVPTIPSRLLTGILRDFQQKYPDIDIVLFEGTPRELVDWLEDGVIDIATVTHPQGYALAMRFLRAEAAIAVSTGHPLASAVDVPLERLQQEALIGPRADYGTLSTVLGHTQIPRLRHEVSTMDTIFAMVRENMGAALVLKMLVDPHAEGMKTLPLNPRIFVDIFLAARIRSPAAEVFAESASTWALAHGFSADDP